MITLGIGKEAAEGCARRRRRGLGHDPNRPAPSTRSAPPVVADANGDARYVTMFAISSGSPTPASRWPVARQA